ncbi:MAG TPA: hypothetical protein VMJ65_06425 [Solirubrobacteraceae bacterium]|nr:hypothetical protein [Solirubrobacteraceae bacterium]
MSKEVLTQLLGTHAFDGSPLHVDMPAFHVPFDDRGVPAPRAASSARHEAPNASA